MSVYIFDFTLKAENIEPWEIQDELDEICKKYKFQKEESESGYLHYQGRISLLSKARPNTQNKFQPWVNHCHWSVTSSRGAQSDEYVCKVSTRVDGPWEHRGRGIFIPRQLVGLRLRPWQQQLLDKARDPEQRQINCIYDPVGCIGKSTISLYLRCHKIAKLIPPLNDAKDIMQAVCSMGPATCYIADLPRGMPKKALGPFWSALEKVKDGYCYDTRYRLRELIMNPPAVIVFTNVLPEKMYLSEDRWNIWKVEDNILSRFLDDDPPGVDICNN